MRAHKAYTIIEAPEVTDKIADSVRDHPRIEDVFEALKWRVARDPECGTIVEHEGTTYRLIFFAPVKAAKNSQALAKYTVDDSIGEVVIHDVFMLSYDDAIAYSPRAFDLSDGAK